VKIPKGLVVVLGLLLGIYIGGACLHYAGYQEDYVTFRFTITVTPTAKVYGADIPTYSGIENIYIVDNTHGGGWAVNFSNHENVLGTITASGGSCSIDYNKHFVIVVAVKGHDENMAYVQKENLKVELAASGSFTISAENSSDADEYVFDDGTPTYIRVNAVWDNNGNGYKLPAGGSLSLDTVKLWLWG